ncbi:MAG: GNAT family N-acetyltransferase [Bacteroidia bacterium]
MTKFILRPWQTGDEPALVKYGDNYDIWMSLRDTFPHPYTWNQAAAWIELANAHQPYQNFAIVVNGEAIGGVGIALGEGNYRKKAEIGYWLGQPFWGKGIATEALNQMTEYAFHSFDICRLEAHVYSFNTASCRVLEKAGYELEGIMRQSIVKANQVYDAYLYAKLKNLP